ncbi:cation-translocating P-type ATPase [Geomonas anaerohicana]|uniref:Cation-transporting P-type ATPase n=1 Tax=Geomonas anaerohicana TaxID=2798583 RepID=A0ABS0YJH6_9BACT|nr:cation-transporting P-type ATPase [Geomonas anaerohicana]MBJ6752469.1 cation-transporting P-type ATPase [Geomonas anaerohicana]
MNGSHDQLHDNLPWHELPVPELMAALGTSAGGLSAPEAAARLSRYGPNTIRAAAAKPLYLKLIADFSHPMALLLWGGGAMAWLGGTPELAVAIWSVVFINAVFSFWQEFRAEQAVEALQKLLPAQATVLRDGGEQQIPARELVPGDLVLVNPGDRISADARLIEEWDLRVDQSTLSGEAHPARKSADPLSGQPLSRTELPNLIFAGTSAVAGTGRAVVCATGMRTEFGRIAHLATATSETPSPLQIEIDRMTRVVTALALATGTIFFVLSVGVLGRELHTGFIFAVGMVVAFVPEGLLPTVSLSLAMAVQRMAKRNALVKKLSSVEALGCCTVICTDKTGTLTQNEMTVREIWLEGTAHEVSGVGYAPRGEIGQGAPGADLTRLLTAAALCNDARLVEPQGEGEPWCIIGDPTEGALIVAARKGGVDPEAQGALLPRLREIPFDSARKRMTSVHREGEGETAFVKGAPAEVAALCTTVARDGNALPLDAALAAEVLGQVDAYARQGYRVLAVAERRLPREMPDYTAETVERELTLLGLVSMNDPPRPEVASAVHKCRRAGIRVVMVTGDYGLTAESVARRIGVLGPDEPCRVVSGAELDAMDGPALDQALSGAVIFARVSPEHKLRVVSALQQKGEIVAVTGDGVNDAPALKKADIGVAMGLAGTDVAKEAADMILLDDNFASIVNTIEEGRAVYANIRKFVTYIFTSNMAEAWPFILQITLNVPLALTVMQVLAIDLGADILPALALGTEPPEPGIMERPPRPRSERLVNRALLLRALVWLGSLMALCCLAGFFLVYLSYGYADLRHLPRLDLVPYHERLLSPGGNVYVLASTMFFAGVIGAQVGNAYCCRSERFSVLRIGLFANRFLVAGIAFQLLFCLALIYLPPLQRLFEVAALPPRFWGVIACYPVLLFLAEEGRKWWLRKREAKRAPGGAS